MLHTLTAYTAEIDEVNDAVSEVLFQLDLENSLLDNSVGLLSCYAEFCESGVVKALCDALPFPVVGTTTLGCAVGGHHGQLSLTLVVLTADDVSFETALSAPLSDNLEAGVEEAYNRAASALKQKPALMFTMAPLIYQYAGDQYVEALDRISGGVPNFGTVTVDHTPDYSQCGILYGGEHSNEKLALVLCAGNLQPEFFMASLPKDKIFEQSAVITDADGSILKSVNNLSLYDYLETLGVASDGKIADGVNTIPFVIDYGDGSEPVSRAMFAFTEEGYGVCGGVMPVGSTLSFGNLSREDVLSTTNIKIDEAMTSHRNRALLIYCCIGRFLALGLDSSAEMESVERGLNGEIPYSLCYSGGEICPVRLGDTWVNRFHNNTFVACAL